MFLLFLVSIGIFPAFTQVNTSVYQVNLGEKYCLRVLEKGPEPCNASSGDLKLTHLDFFDSLYYFFTEHNYCPIKHATEAGYNKKTIKDSIRDELARIKVESTELDLFIKSQKNMYVEYNKDCSISVVFQSISEAEHPGYCYQDIRGGAQNFEGKMRAGTVIDGYNINSKIYKFYISKVDGSEVEYSDEEKQEYYKP